MTQIKIAGQMFEAPDRYTEGHTLTEREANVLNQTLHENLRNNFSKRVKDAGDDQEKIAALAGEFAEYASSYEFGVRIAGGGGAARRDPVETEARKLARAAINEAIAAKGQKVKDVDKDAYEAAIEKHAQSEAIVALARKRVEERKAVVGTGDMLADLGLGTGAPAEETNDETPRSRRSRAA